ncbi:MAG: A/G-specific adenine glycosylase [Chitinophagaceae bacterium]|nr:A/G-specific adenine glycosylase [Chitinophagaceae bacterium]MCB9047452.1 A/G-specific adenine glycosylase [Chitinophagales bacterium]
MNKAQQQYFTKQLVQWHSVDNNRNLPWKEETDPYKIWLSEVILQQTRAQQGLPYYLRFTEAYPTIEDMASADDEEVFRLWQGLGYYNRCRNMLATARYVANELGGHFPDSYATISSLKGVGPYTAAAIASFAYGLPHAVVDGNVYRVLSRYFGIDTPIDSTTGKKEFTALADRLLDKTDSAGYNQAIMDLGATICKPSGPLCGECPLQKKCFARQHDIIKDLPVKSKKLKIQTRYFHYILFTHNHKLWIHKRTGKDIWQNLYEPYLVEHTGPLDAEKLANNDTLNSLKLKKGALSDAGSSSQRLTHRIIDCRFYTCPLTAVQATKQKGGLWVSFTELDKYAFPKSVVSFLEKKSYFY